MHPSARRSAPSPLLGLLSGGLLLSGGALLASQLRHRRQARQARRLHRAMVDLLLNALSAGDETTAEHSRRVANLTDTLAAGFRLSAEQRATLRLAALLHDMGKIDDDFFDIVHSREKLTPRQRTQIRHHPHQSAHILQPLEEVHPGLMEIVSSHHECWDGSGYPHGHAGEEIPLAARIITVADVFDALTQRRPYREPMPVEEALEELRHGAGRRFDPALVERVQRPEVLRRWRHIVEAGQEGRLVDGVAGRRPGG